jgi:hypothetical protein
MTHMQFLKLILTEIQGKSLFKPIEKDSETSFLNSNRVLIHEKTEMPLGAKLTQNDFKCNFWNGFWHRMETKIYSNQLKRLKQFFKGLKWVWTQEMTKIPFSWILQVILK